MKTLPAEDEDRPGTADHIVVAPYYKDEKTGAVYVHQDLRAVAAPWAEEEHIGPPKGDEKFGDVESWVSFVQRHAQRHAGEDEGEHASPFVTWNSKGLRAVLDYHGINPGRCQWLASCPFVQSPEFRLWSSVATGQAIPHQKFVEFLDDHLPDVVEPDPAALLNLLRGLRASVSAQAETELRADGTTALKFGKDQRVQSGTLDLPPEITIGIPVLRGHVGADGKPVLYKLVCKLRVSVDDNAKLSFRLVMPQAERVLEEVYAERVQSAKELLGDGFAILRAAE